MSTHPVMAELTAHYRQALDLAEYALKSGDGDDFKFSKMRRMLDDFVVATGELRASVREVIAEAGQIAEGPVCRDCSRESFREPEMSGEHLCQECFDAIMLDAGRCEK